MEKPTSITVQENEEKRKTRRNQYIVTFLVCILSFSQGSFAGWSSPVLPLLQSNDTPAHFPPIGEEEASWVGSLYSLSSIFAIPLGSYSIDKLGRKFTGYMVAMPFIIAWVLILCADSVIMLYVARCVGGLSIGAVGVLVPTYINDVAEDDIRGRLGAIFSVSQFLGMLYSYAVGSYVSYMWFNISGLMEPVAFLLGFFWLPESPLFLLVRGKEQEAKKSLSWLRDGSCTEEEFLRTKLRAEEFVKNRQKKITLRDLMNRSTFRALLICLGLMLNNQLSGVSVMIVYIQTIFQDTGSSLSANVSSIVVGSILVLGSALSSAIIERSGRRVLLMTANFLTAASLFPTGYYFYMKELGSNVSFIQWLPVTCLSLYILCSGLALSPISVLMTTELPSPQARGMVQSISVVFLSVLAFVTAKTFTNLTHLIGTYGCFWFYGGSCALCAVVIYFTVPETKGRSSEDIVAQLSSKQYVVSGFPCKHGCCVKKA